MCNFFSLVSNGNGKIMYFDHKIRKQIMSNKLSYEQDSHTSIADYYGYKGKMEDKLNKYEYNPLTKVFTIDQINTINDSQEVEKYCNNLDFKKIVPKLIVKPIINPLQIKRKNTNVTGNEIKLLKEWASVRDSVRDSVWASVWASVGDSVWASVRDSVWASVRDSVWALVRASVRDSVWASVRDSVWASVRDSVWASVGDSVWAYYSSFFKIKYKYDFTSCIKLWEAGFVPSYDGEVWRLHSGKKANIVYEYKLKEKK